MAVVNAHLTKVKQRVPAKQVKGKIRVSSRGRGSSKTRPRTGEKKGK
jgi:hypothetical protein